MQTVKDYLGEQHWPRIPFEKKRIEELRFSDLPSDSVLLYGDEKGQIVVAKTYGGTSWSSIQPKVSKAQKTKGILYVFGVYYHTSDHADTWIQKEDRKTILGFYR